MSHNHPVVNDNLTVDEGNPNFYQNVMHAQMTRREVMAGGSLLAACGSSDLLSPTPAVARIAKSTADRVVVPSVASADRAQWKYAPAVMPTPRPRPSMPEPCSR